MTNKPPCAANFNMTQVETLASIREMGLTCVRIGDSQYRLNYPHGSPYRPDWGDGSNFCADSLAAAYQLAINMDNWGPYYGLAMRCRRAAAAAAAAANA